MAKRADGRLLGNLDREAVWALVERSCASQGFPVKVSSPMVVDRVCTLLGRGGREVLPALTWGGSEAPDRLRTLGIHPVDAHLSGVDDDVLEYGLDDSSLSIEVQRRPLAS